VITIIAVAPMNSMTLRSATDNEAPTVDLIWVVSAVSRDISSPLRAASKKDGDSEIRCANTSHRKSATMRSPSVITRKCRAALAPASTATTRIITPK